MTPTTAAEKVKAIIESWESATNHAPVGEWSVDIFLKSSEGSRLVGELVEGWISVKDSIPESRQKVLCYTDFGRIIENSWEAHTDQNEDWFKRYFTHWQPLPEPPKIN